MTDIQWGPEIKVEGKRPEWLKDGEQFQAGGGGFEWFGIVSTGKPYIWNAQPIREPSWDGVDHIRLPANHPHYAQQTPTPDVVGEAQQAAVMQLAEAATALSVALDGRGWVKEREAILAGLRAVRDAGVLLPEPSDGDLVIAREIVIDCLGMKDHPYAIKIRNGERDGVCQEALAGIKRGRALERGEA